MLASIETLAHGRAGCLAEDVEEVTYLRIALDAASKMDTVKTAMLKLDDSCVVSIFSSRSSSRSQVIIPRT